MKIFIHTIILIFVSFSATAQSNTAITNKFLKLSFSSDTTILPYRLFVPERAETGRLYPLILTLHGSGERGNDNEKQIALHGIATAWADSNLQKRSPCFIFSPQCPENNRWVDTYWKVGSYSQDTITISNELDAVINLIDFLIAEYPIDTSRIYITGLSMGGFGTWDLITRYPDKFAAAIPMSGAGDPEKAHLINELPVWVFHGEMDLAVPAEGSRNMVNALRKFSSNVLYTELEKCGHVIWKELYENRLLQDWLFSQSKK
ncbi:MAG: prolyl oligopeptidase family serine peptidase [Melioribacteraceae bacterium]|nr:prolyl oligopeptidase family serine peptidase [Melioribacteraceae bacterium]